MILTKDLVKAFDLTEAQAKQVDDCVDRYSKGWGLSLRAKRVYEAAWGVFGKSTWDQARCMLDAKIGAKLEGHADANVRQNAAMVAEGLAETFLQLQMASNSFLNHGHKNSRSWKEWAESGNGAKTVESIMNQCLAGLEERLPV